MAINNKIGNAGIVEGSFIAFGTMCVVMVIIAILQIVGQQMV